MKTDTRLKLQNKNLGDIVRNLEGMPPINNIWNILRRLVITATVYHIWVERNRRLFQNLDRSSDCVKKIIVEEVKLKLSSLRVKDYQGVREVAKLWNVQWR